MQSSALWRSHVAGVGRNAHPPSHPLTELNLSGRQQFLVGANGQGKTNLLEAVGFVTALRSQELAAAFANVAAALDAEAPATVIS